LQDCLFLNILEYKLVQHVHVGCAGLAESVAAVIIVYFTCILYTVEPPVSNHPKCQVEVVAYESLDHNGQNFSYLEYDNFRDLSMC